MGIFSLSCGPVTCHIALTQMDFLKLIRIVLLWATFNYVNSYEIPRECVGMEPYAVGVCRKAFAGYFFDIMSKKCQKYETDGCYLKPGNAHSFPTQLECIKKCKEPIEAAGRAQLSPS